VDAFWAHLKERGFNPEIPRDASWGQRYFHMLDPDGHELSFARRCNGFDQEDVASRPLVPEWQLWHAPKLI
jgi:hypothetical protein